MAATKTQKERNTSAHARKSAKARSQAALRGWETRRKAAREAERKRRAAAKLRAERKAARALAEAKRLEKGRRARRRGLAKARAKSALATFVEAVDHDVRERELAVVRRGWHRRKEALEREYEGDWDAYMAILDRLADEVGTDWDIAYQSPSAGPE